MKRFENFLRRLLGIKSPSVDWQYIPWPTDKTNYVFVDDMPGDTDDEKLSNAIAQSQNLRVHGPLHFEQSVCLSAGLTIEGVEVSEIKVNPEPQGALLPRKFRPGSASDHHGASHSGRRNGVDIVVEFDPHRPTPDYLGKVGSVVILNGVRYVPEVPLDLYNG